MQVFNVLVWDTRDRHLIFQIEVLAKSSEDAIERVDHDFAKHAIVAKIPRRYMYFDAQPFED